MISLNSPPVVIESAVTVTVPVRKVASSALAAFVLYVGLNIIFFPAVRTLPDSNGMSVSVNAFNALSRPPKIAILGSSVAKHLFFGIPENEVRNQKIANLTFNLQIVSDGFILSNKLLNPPRQPKLVVLCVTPRDFVDNDVKNPTRTTTFRRMVMLNDLPVISQVLHLSFSDSVLAVYNLLCCFYDQRAAFQKHLLARVIGVYDAVAGRSVALKQLNEDSWTHSMREYAWRYEGISTKALEPQIEVFERTIRLCQQRGMKVLLVNLPLSAENLTLLPQGFYTEYRQRLKKSTEQFGCSFFDCVDTGKKITKLDFEDCAHLNEAGAQKVYGMIKPAVEMQTTSASSVSDAGK